MQSTFASEIDLDAVLNSDVNDLVDEEVRKSLSSSFSDSSQGFSYQSGGSFIQESSSSMLGDIFKSSQPAVQKRKGRKPLRPFDPIKKKTEEKDKYWLRAFRAYIKENYQEFQKNMDQTDKIFWEYYMSNKGKPSRGSDFRSYGRQYKNYLFSHESFQLHFRQWFNDYGEQELRKKCEPSSDRWFVFLSYAAEELQNYSPFQTNTSRQRNEEPQQQMYQPMDLDEPGFNNFQEYLIDEDPDSYMPIF